MGISTNVIRVRHQVTIDLSIHGASVFPMVAFGHDEQWVPIRIQIAYMWTEGGNRTDVSWLATISKVIPAPETPYLVMCKAGSDMLPPHVVEKMEMIVNIARPDSAPFLGVKE